MLQIAFGSSDNYTARVQSPVASYILDNLAGFVKAGAIRDGVKNKEDVCIRHNTLKLLFGVLKERRLSSFYETTSCCVLKSHFAIYADLHPAV